MKTKLLTKIVAVAMAMITTINSYPLVSYGNELQLEQEISEAVEDWNLGEPEIPVPVEAVKKEEAEIVAEIVENRDEFSKEYLLDNGQQLLMVYPTAVHYEEDGNWMEIDNTLKAELVDGVQMYSNTSGEWDVKLPQEISKDNAVHITKGENSLSFSFAGQLSKETELKKAVQSSGLTLAPSLSLEAEQSLEAEKVIEKVEGENFEIENIKASRAQIQEFEIDTAIDTQEDLTLKKINTAVEYKSIYEDVDLKYDLISNKLKESIIIDFKPESELAYKYVIETDNLVLQLQEDNSIHAYDKDDMKEPVFYMPAPFMVDSNNIFNSNVNVSLNEIETGYELIYTLPLEWLQDSETEYPVILDPVIQPELTVSNIRDQTVASKRNLDYTWGMVEVGYYSTEGKERAFLKYADLPELTSADVITYADISLYKAATTYTEVQVNAHQVNGTWESNTITWANMPSYNPTVEDFQMVKNQGWCTWDITNIASGWYEGSNTGVMLKTTDAVENAAQRNFHQFYSSDYGSVMPVLRIQYVNNTGLEGYWDYTAHSAGRAGIGYVNDYTGNLVWVSNGLGVSGNLMPVQINHVYNANDKDTDKFGMGYGWRTNYNQLVYQWEHDSDYYIWEDEDGTKHYFKKKSTGVYEDESGGGLILKTTGSGTTKYSLEDEDGNKSYFDTYGRLTKISNNQADKSEINISYTNNTGKYINYITDGAGRKYRYIYTGLKIKRIAYFGSGTSELEDYEYYFTGDNLTKITYPDNEYVQFAYTSNHLLNKVTDIDGYNLRYEYNTTSAEQPNRIKKVTEYDVNTIGGQLNIEYANNQTTFTDHNGNTEIKQFNNWGNTVSVQDGLGRAQFAEYSKDDNDTGEPNQMLLASKMQNTVTNIVKNGSFEKDSQWSLAKREDSTSYGRTSFRAYSGEYSYYIQKISSNVLCSMMQSSSVNLNLEKGKTYTFSAYVYTKDMIGDGLGAKISVTIDGKNYASEVIKTNSDWKRLEVTFTVPENITNTTAKIYIQNGTKGTAYFDALQLEEGSTASRYNLIENGDFRHIGTYSTDAYAWAEGSGCTSTEKIVTLTDTVAPHVDGRVYQFVGNATVEKRAYQDVQVSGEAGDVFTLAGWGKGDSVPYTTEARRFGLLARFYNTDNTQSEVLINFNPDTDSDVNWQYAAGRLVAPKDYNYIRVLLVYEMNANTAYFDGIQLFKEEFGHSYVYDDDGNVISSTDLQEKTTTYEYVNNDLTKAILPTGAQQTYTYDSYHNVKTATSTTGIVSTFTYDDYGNNTSVTVGTGSDKITSSATYTSNGNYLASTKNEMGEVTSYNFNSITGELESVNTPGSDSTTEVEYQYDSMGRVTYEFTVMDGYFIINNSNYIDDKLSSLGNLYNFSYYFDYGLFDQLTDIQVGSRTLITHTYTNDRNRNLSRSTYGNGDYVDYEYDSYGRIVSIGYEDIDKAEEYIYDNDGNIGILKDNVTGRTSKNYYDMSDRLMKYEEIGTDYSSVLEYAYDDKSRLTSQKHTLDGTAYTDSYTYDDDNRITKISSGSANTSYTYDTLSRISNFTTKHNSTSILSTQIGYIDPTSSTTSTAVGTWKNTIGGTSKTYTYTYDERGNVLSVSNGTHTTTYVYGDLDQLVRENNQSANKTYTYSYDLRGNIVFKVEYAYTKGTLGQALDTIVYDYDTSWDDLLISYDGNTITSDNIGNPLSDGTWNYQWEHGRQLDSMSKSGTSIDYSYDSDGLRTSKNVNEVITEYEYLGGNLVQMEQGSNKLRFTYDALGASGVIFNGTNYYYEKNAQGDILGIVDTNRNFVVNYNYDAWGTLLSTTGSMANTLGELNPLRYRGYVYDNETNFYYLQSRYYNPAMGRFINADSIVDTEQGLNSTNMFAYCGNNPVSREDTEGRFFDTVFDVISLAMSVADIISNPYDLMSWVGLVGDVVDLFPGVTGVGELAKVFRAADATVSTTVTINKTADSLDSVIDTANALKKSSPNNSVFRSSTGTYEIEFASGYTYVGKGSYDRMITSGKHHSSPIKKNNYNGDVVTSMKWQPAKTHTEAFVREYLWMDERGLFSVDNEYLTYNKIWSPGKKIFEQLIFGKK